METGGNFAKSHFLILHTHCYLRAASVSSTNSVYVVLCVRKASKIFNDFGMRSNFSRLCIYSGIFFQLIDITVGQQSAC